MRYDLSREGVGGYQFRSKSLTTKSSAPSRASRAMFERTGEENLYIDWRTDKKNSIDIRNPSINTCAAANF